VPISAVEIDRTTRRLETMGQLLTPLRTVIKPDHMPAAHITKWTKIADFNEHGAAGVTAHCHASFKDNVRPCLLRQRRLMRRLIRTMERFSKAAFIVWRKQNDNCLGSVERGIENFADVWSGLTGRQYGFIPFKGMKANGPQKREHRITKSRISPMDDEYDPRPGSLGTWHGR
jgi:hypothetical protein